MARIGTRPTSAEVKGTVYRIPALVYRDGAVYVDAVLPDDLAVDKAGVVDLIDRIPKEMRSSDTADIRIEMEMDIETLFLSRVIPARLRPQTIRQVCKQYQDLYRELHGRTPDFELSGRSWIYIEGMGGREGKPVRRREVEGRIAEMRAEIVARRSSGA